MVPAKVGGVIAASNGGVVKCGSVHAGHMLGVSTVSH
jgi:hypothetical protein